MMHNNQLTRQRLIGKGGNDLNISGSDWIPRVATWTIDALSQMKVLPMERKRRTLEVSDRIAQFPCTINAEEISVYDSNGCEIPAYKKSKSCSCNKSNIPFTGEQIGVTNPYAPNGWETVQVANVITAGNRNFVLDGNNIILNFDTDKIDVESLEVATYHDDYYDCEVPMVYDNGILLEAISFYILYKYLSRGSHHPVYDLKSSSPVTNPYIQWKELKSKAIASVRNDLYNADGWRNFFYNSTFDPRR